MRREFIPGRLYISFNSNTIVKCISDEGEHSYDFTAAVVSSDEYPVGEVCNHWNRSSFELVEEAAQEPELNVIL
jgi:hypothetical protein